MNAPAWNEAGVTAAIRDLRARLLTAVERVIPRGSSVALLDFPNHGNVGDSLIWVGELALLRDLDVRVEYVATTTTYRAEHLRSRLRPDGLVLLHGGGNFGDLWPLHHEHRESVVEELREFAVVQLPQSIHFQNPARLERTREALLPHPRLTVLVRDQHSLEVARDQVGIAAVLCPDSAFAVGPLRRPIRPRTAVVWHSRDDKEAPGAGAVTALENPDREDWVAEPRTPLIRLDAILNGSAAAPDWLTKWLYRSLAWERVRRGCRFLARGRVVATNRLHGQILAMLLGIPCFVSDTKQGKVGDFFRTWLADRIPEAWSDSEGEALARAVTLARRLDGARD